MTETADTFLVLIIRLELLMFSEYSRRVNLKRNS